MAEVVALPTDEVRLPAPEALTLRRAFAHALFRADDQSASAEAMRIEVCRLTPRGVAGIHDATSQCAHHASMTP